MFERVCASVTVWNANPLTVDLVHPTGNQFARHLLQALEEKGMLGTFHTTLGFPASTWTRFFPNPIRAECLRRTYPMSPDKLRTRPGRESLRLAAQKFRWSRLNRHEEGWASIDQVYQDLDRAVARRIKHRSPAKTVSGIYGYEDGCLETFRAAKARGIRCFYDLPIAYWETVRKLLEEEKQRLPEWEPTLVGTRDSAAKLERKSAELALADVVICPSPFVLHSLPPAMRDEKSCLVAEFGSPPRNWDAAQRASGSFGQTPRPFRRIDDAAQRPGRCFCRDEIAETARCRADRHGQSHRADGILL